jgi:predicted DNA-binding transcriptional regulator AlpA
MGKQFADYLRALTGLTNQRFCAGNPSCGYLEGDKELEQKASQAILPKGAVQMGTRLIDIHQLAEKIGLKPKTIRNRLCEKTFPLRPVKQGGRKNFWLESEVDKYIEELKETRDNVSCFVEANKV